VRLIERPIDEVLAATAFLTRIPTRRRADGACGAGAFGFVGAALGLAAAPIVLGLGPKAPLAAASLIVAEIALLTGALHLDGLADTADALAAPDRAAADRARKDPRVGAAGAAAVVLVVLVETASIATLIERAGAGIAALSFMAAMAGSRAVGPVLAVVARTRLAPGLGAWFGACVAWPAAALAGATALAVGLSTAFVPGGSGVPIGLIGGWLFSAVASIWLPWARGALDGDALGATVELTAAAILVATLAAT
jgi:adenosylcobinamide-GDP ribazoletransferase